jgi:hypothetical protein
VHLLHSFSQPLQLDSFSEHSESEDEELSQDEDEELSQDEDEELSQDEDEDDELSQDEELSDDDDELSQRFLYVGFFSQRILGLSSQSSAKSGQLASELDDESYFSL